MTHPLLALARLSVTDPRGAARVLMARDFPPPVLVDALALVAVVGGIVGTLSAMLVLQIAPPPGLSAEEIGVARDSVAGPFRQTIVQAGGLLIVAGAIWGLGRAFGGTGGFRDALSITIWLSALALAMQIGLLALLVVFQPLAVLALFGIAIVNLWLLTSFVAELHGFESAWSVLFAIFGFGFALVLLLALLAPLSGPVAGG